MFGLKQQHIDLINQCFAKYTQIEQVLIYGSRAKGNYKNGSDIDLTIVGKADFSILLKLQNQLDDLLLPYKIDLSLHHQITNPDLLDHMQRVGKVFYQKQMKSQIVTEPETEYKRMESDLSNNKDSNNQSSQSSHWIARAPDPRS